MFSIPLRQRLRLTALLAGLVLVLASPRAGAVGVTGFLDALPDQLESRRTFFLGQGDKAARKAAKKLAAAKKAVTKPKVAKSLVQELKGATKAAGIIEKKLPEEAGILATIDGAIPQYLVQVTQSKKILQALSEQPDIGRKTSKRLNGKLKKADAALEAYTVATTRKSQLKAMLKVAKVTAGLADVGGETATWVVSDLAVADGAPGPNALATARTLLGDEGIDLDAEIGNAVRTSPLVTLIEMWSIEDFEGDDFVLAGLINGFDTDGNTGDNFNGLETFQTQGRVETDGHPFVRETTALGAGGVYTVSIDGSGLTLGNFRLSDGATLAIDGSAQKEPFLRNQGEITVAVGPEFVFGLAGQAGDPDSLLAALTALLDVDTTGDENPDALSAVLTFSAVGARKTSP